MTRRIIKVFMVILVFSMLFMNLRNLQFQLPNIFPYIPIVEAPYWDDGSDDPDWYYNATETQSQTSSTNWQEKVSLTFAPNETAYYLILAFAETKYSSHPSRIKFTHKVSQEETINGGDFNVVDLTTNLWVPFSSLWYQELNTSTHIFNMTYKTSNAAEGIYIRGARILAWKLDELITEYAVSEAEDSTSSESWQDKTTLTFTGANSEYLIMANSELRATGGTTAEYQLDWDNQQISFNNYFSQASSDPRWYCFTIYKSETIGASTQTFKTQWRSGGAWNSYIAKSRIFALNLGVFDDDDWTSSQVLSATNDTSSSGWVTHNSHTFNSTGNSVLAFLGGEIATSDDAYGSVRTWGNATSVITGGSVLSEYAEETYKGNYTLVGSFRTYNQTENDRLYFVNFSRTGGGAWVAVRRTNIVLFRLQESPILEDPIIDGVEIENMEGCGNWVFAEEKYYDFRADYDNVNQTLTDYVGVSFFDDENHNVTALYDYSEDEFVIDSGDDYVWLSNGSIVWTNITGFYTLNVTFSIYFQNTIVDTVNASIYQFINYTSDYSSGWVLVASDYFNIYNVGGQTLGSFTTSGNAGRLAGGDVFDFWAHSNSSYVEQSLIFRHLQHIKLLPEITYMYDSAGSYATFKLTWGIDYCLQDENDFITGWEVELLANEIEIVNERHINFTLYWFARDPAGAGLYKVKQEFNYFFTRAVFGDDQNGSTRIWFDFWFNRLNASTTVAGRVNAFEYPMSDSLGGWLAAWGIGNWGVDDDKTKESMMVDDLRDSDGNVTSTKEVKLIRVRFRLTVYDSAPDHTQIVTVSDFNVFDLSFGDKTKPFEGIQTPVFDETRVPTVQVGGFLGFIWSGLLWIADAIGRAFGPAILGFWNIFVGFMDFLFSWTGTPNAFTQFVALILNAWNWFVSSVAYVVTLLVQGFLLLAEVMTKFMSLVVTVVTQFISVAQWTWWILDTGFWSTVSLWDTLGMSSWLVIGAIVYPIYLLAVWEEYGFDAMIAEIAFLLGVVTFLIKGFLTLISFAVTLIYSLIELVPIAE